jgi:hypothetical protein
MIIAEPPYKFKPGMIIEMKSIRLTTVVVSHYSKTYSAVDGMVSHDQYTRLSSKSKLRKCDILGITKVTYT